MTAKLVETVCLDTQVFVATGFGFGGKSFEALKKHISSKRLKLVMTDITVREVKSRIKRGVAEELVNQRSYVNRARALFNSTSPDILTGLKKIDPDLVTKDLCDQFDAFLADTKATVIETAHLPAGEVFAKYFSGEPPFGDNEEKRYEFPDAFTVQALAEWAEENETPIFVVSKDSLFQQACSSSRHLIPKDTINEVLDHVASDDAQLAAFVRAETMQRISWITRRAKEEFEDRYYWVEGEDGEAKVEVLSVDFDGEPDIIDIDKEYALLQLVMNAVYSAELSYNDSATASYAEETLIYVERRNEEVQREKELFVEVQVFYENMNPESFEIVTVSVESPHKGFGIEP